MADQTPKQLLAALEARDGRRSAWTGNEGDTLVPQHRQGGMGGRAVCTVDGCERTAEVLKRTLCRTHYARLRKGRPLEVPVRAIRKERGTCRTADCDRLDDGPHGYCFMHLRRLQKHGNTGTVISHAERAQHLAEHPRWSGDEPTYNAAHLRVKAERGSAKRYPCIDCGRDGQHWSYNHLDPNEVVVDGVAYSAESRFYEPRCARCHKHFDMRARGAAA